MCLCLCIWTTFLSSHHLSRYTYSMSAEFCSVCLRTACLPRRRSACFMPSLSRFSVRWFRRKGLAWTLTRFVLSLIGPFQILESLFRGFWGLPIFTAVLSETLVKLPLLLLSSPRPRLDLLGPRPRRVRSIGSRGYLPPLPFLLPQIPRNNLLLRLMPPTSGLELSCRNALPLTTRFIRALSIHIAFRPLSATTTSVTESFWRSVWR